MLVAATSAAYGDDASAPEGSRFAVSGSRSQYVHRIHLYDAQKRQIDPAAEGAPPYSPLATCGKCHAYDQIAHGWHFSAMLDKSDAPDGRPGEPWLYVDRRTGTQIPMSYRDWPGAVKPDKAGLTPAEFIKQFGRHTPGGFHAEAEPERLAIDCMSCHTADRSWSQEAWADQIKAGRLAAASTAAIGLGKVGGAAADQPTVAYDADRYDAEGKFFFDVVRKPANNQCYQCHTVRRGAEGAGGDESPLASDARWMHDDDIHLRAGMSCVDCHRNGIEHHTVRGYAGEKHPAGADAVRTLSCVGCHMDGDDGVGGRLGSPKPLHKGLPPIHFEKMTCTACHSGPTPGSEPVRVQTSMAHALGLPEQRTFAESPAIVEPVWLRVDGKITPHRMVWPAYWGVAGHDGFVGPLDPDQVYSELRRALRLRKSFEEEVVGAGAEEFAKKLTEGLKHIREKVLNSNDHNIRPVYVANGRVYALNDTNDGIRTLVNSAADPYAWPLGHDVRPARQSAGVTGCAECHAPGTPMFYGTVTALGPAVDAEPITKTMHELRGDDAALLAAWEQSFEGRSAFKVLGWTVLGIVALIAVAHLLGGVRAATAWVGRCCVRRGGDQR